MEILKKEIKNEIMEKIANGKKKGITARDCLASFTQLENMNALFTAADRRTLSEILTSAIDFNDDGDFKIILNADIKKQVNFLISKIVLIDEMISHSEFKKILTYAFLALFNFKYEFRDKNENFSSWVIKRKIISISQFCITFLQSFCFVTKKIIVNISNQAYILNKADFDEIKKTAYENYNKAVIDGLNA